MTYTLTLNRERTHRHGPAQPPPTRGLVRRRRREPPVAASAGDGRRRRRGAGPVERPTPAHLFPHTSKGIWSIDNLSNYL